MKQYHSELIAEIDKAETLLRIKRIYDAGKVLEIAIRNKLLSTLPHFVGITRGIIVDSDVKHKSKEIDLIIYDKRYFSGLEIENSINDSVSLISIDTVFGVISIKKTLTISSLKDSIKNINSVYSLNRKELRNQFHYDLSFGKGLLNYKNGMELNRIFSCIVCFNNEFLYKTKKKIRVKREKEEIISYYNKLAKDGRFKNFNIDIVYTVDGTFIQPLIYNTLTKRWSRNIATSLLGTLKIPVDPTK